VFVAHYTNVAYVCYVHIYLAKA